MTLGIDIGGTNITLGLVRDGKVVAMEKVRSFPFQSTCEQTLDYLEKQIRKIITPDITGIGFGVPSVVDVKEGVVYDTANIPSWKEVHLKSRFEEKFGLRVEVNNDSNCYALGAYETYPAASRPESLVAMTLGTGVGMGIINEGKLFTGANCGAGELSCLPYNGATIEDFCSKKFFYGNGIDPIAAGEKALAGDTASLDLFEEFGRHLGYAVCTILYAYDPEVIVLGGGVANNYPLFRKDMEVYLCNNFPYHKAIERLQVDVITRDDIPVLGAASLVK